MNRKKGETIDIKNGVDICSEAMAVIYTVFRDKIFIKHSLNKSGSKWGGYGRCKKILGRKSYSLNEILANEGLAQDIRNEIEDIASIYCKKNVKIEVKW